MNEMDDIKTNWYHCTNVKELKINNENVSTIAETTNNILYVAKFGSDETGNGSLGNPFLSIGRANDVAIAMLNPVTDWDEAVIIYVSPGKYTEHLTTAHRRCFIIGNGGEDWENWTKPTIIYNTGADSDHYPIDVLFGLNLIGITVMVDSGGIYGRLPNKTMCSLTEFQNGYFITNDEIDTSFSVYFNHCAFYGDGFKLEGISNYQHFIAFRNCDIYSGTNTIFSSNIDSGSEYKQVKFENTKIGNDTDIGGNWSITSQWSELYSNGKLTFDTDGEVDIFSTIISKGIHFTSDTPQTKKLVNCLFREIDDGKGDVTADVAVEFIEYSGNHQDHGIDGEVITVSKIKNVGGGQNMYRNIHEALKGSILTDTIINLEGDITVTDPLVLNPNINIQIDGNKKWSLTTSATNLIEVGLNQHVSFVNMKQIIGGKKAILNGNNSQLSFISCGRYTKPNYVNIEINAGDTDSFIYIVKTTLIGTSAPVIKCSDIDPNIFIDRSHLEGDTNYPAITFTVDADNKLKVKNTTLLHGGGSETVPMTNTSGSKVDVAIYGTAMNANFPTANFTNTIVNASNVVDTEITF